MKAGVTLILLAGIAAIGAGGYYAYSANAYVEAVDRRVEREIEDAELTIVRLQLADRGGDRAAQLRELYRGPSNEQLNLRYGRLVNGWRESYPRIARIPMIPDPLSDIERLGVEIDERMGPGVFAVMQDEYERYREDAPRREAIRRAEQEAAAQADAERYYLRMQQQERQRPTP